MTATDELCEQVEALKRDEWSAGFNAGCDAVNAAIEEGKAHYEVENAKLRELIADVHESLKADKAGMFHNLTLSAMEDDMRELGIEVD